LNHLLRWGCPFKAIAIQELKRMGTRKDRKKETNKKMERETTESKWSGENVCEQEDRGAGREESRRKSGRSGCGSKFVRSCFRSHCINLKVSKLRQLISKYSSSLLPL